MNRKTCYAYVDRFGTVRNDFEAHGATPLEIVECLDPERDDPLVNPWRRTYRAAMRRALGH